MNDSARPRGRALGFGRAALAEVLGADSAVDIVSFGIVSQPASWLVVLLS